MLKKNKLRFVISSSIILLPIFFGLIMWNHLPDTMTTHWGADGNADGFSGKAFAVFGLPVIWLALHFVCLLATLLDKKQQEQNPKALRIIFWIIPSISLFINGIMYRAAFGKEFDLVFFIPALFSLLLIFMGNYLPKIKQNRTLGIKISWTLNNEENWNKTHRLAGKVWVISGLVMLFSVFLPRSMVIWVLAGAFFAMIIIPIVYSYRIYRRHQVEGVAYNTPPKSKAEKIAVKISAVLIPLILVGVAILMFTGNIEVLCEDTAFKINATYWTDIAVDYSEVDTIEYREKLDAGMRTNGFASARLSMGIFENEEFGLYTLYADTGAKGFVVLKSQGKALVIGLRDAEATQAIYNTVLSKIDGRCD